MLLRGGIGASPQGIVLLTIQASFFECHLSKPQESPFATGFALRAELEQAALAASLRSQRSHPPINGIRNYVEQDHQESPKPQTLYPNSLLLP